jgi:hypothetical protein
MKALPLICSLWLVATCVSAQTRIPRHVYELAQLEEARAKAAEGGKALSFVLTNPETRCGLAINATNEAFTRLRNHSEIVLLRTGDRAQFSQQVTPLILRQFSQPELGRFIPKVVVTSPDMSRIFGYIRYEDMRENRHFMSLARQVREFTSAPESAPLAEGDFSWYLKTGRVMNGSFIRVEGENLVMKMTESGNESTRPLSDFADGTVLQARVLAAGGSLPATGPIRPGDAAPMEVWTSADGVRQIQARFISLSGETLTLVNDQGQTLQFGIGLLNEESRILALSRAGVSP